MSCQGIWRTAGSDSAGPRLGRRIRRLIKLPGDANPLKFGPVRSEPPGQWFSASAVHENHLESLGGKMLMHTAPPPPAPAPCTHCLWRWGLALVVQVQPRGRIAAVEGRPGIPEIGCWVDLRHAACSPPLQPCTESGRNAWAKCPRGPPAADQRGCSGTRSPGLRGGWNPPFSDIGEQGVLVRWVPGVST